MSTQPHGMNNHVSAHYRQLLRHFADLRNGTHGDGLVSRAAKEHLFGVAVDLLAPYARQALTEMNEILLLDTGAIKVTGLNRLINGDVVATWTLGWPEQEQAEIEPVTLQAFYGSSFHHPHLHGSTVEFWPLNIYTVDDAEAMLPTLRAIAAADLHNLVFQSDYRIVPATTKGQHSL